MAPLIQAVAVAVQVAAPLAMVATAALASLFLNILMFTRQRSAAA
jgi:hypothetical protein